MYYIVRQEVLVSKWLTLKLYCPSTRVRLANSIVPVFIPGDVNHSIRLTYHTTGVTYCVKR